LSNLDKFQIVKELYLQLSENDNLIKNYLLILYLLNELSLLILFISIFVIILRQNNKHIRLIQKLINRLFIETSLKLQLTRLINLTLLTKRSIFSYFFYLNSSKNIY